MPEPILASFLSVMEALRPALTRPGYANALVVACGWLLTHGQHAVTESLVATGVATRRHHEAFHRFFSRGTWNPDRLGYWLFRRLLPFLNADPVRAVIDDTVAPKKGAGVFGIGSHVDAVRSTRKHRIFVFGHCWVVLAIMVRLPFSPRIWALPVLFRLARNLKECEKHGAVYRKKTELAREMLDVLCEWVGGRRVELAADSAYCNDTIMRDLPGNVVLFGAMRPDAVLTAPPEPKGRSKSGGRPSKRGKALPKPEAIARDGRRPWKTTTAHLYGRKTKVLYKTMTAQWYRACGTRLLRIVVVATSGGNVPYRVFFCTDASVSVEALLETYAGRWGIEVFFREAKQLLGFADSSARRENAVLRTAPFVGLLYTVLVLWFLEGASNHTFALPPVRPWYTHKSGVSFADMLRAARRALAGFDVLDPANHFKDLRKPAAGPRNAPAEPSRHAA